MKKLIIYAALLLSSANVFAQKDGEAKKILDAAAAKYRTFTTIKTDFVFTIDAQASGIRQSQNGVLITQPKANKFKITLYKPGSADLQQEITSNGKTQWTYLKTEKEVTVNDAGKAADSFNPAQLFTLYQKGYKYLFTGTQKIGGKLYQIVDLTPEDSKASFFKIRLAVDKTSKQIYSATIFDNTGGKYTYTLRGAATTTDAPESTFIFDAKTHPGVEVVDLR
ncbi:outer membrane lipoprotein carrier protein LolA [Mucilaginibacter calamicampi]|uniref:Outer membrane lipoprotein carrier protein LolA n=1 Tax=Mucilaginibacter calamicampi TaxID=1302352 RepID=A0ABW2Z0E5_9SPHI